MPVIRSLGHAAGTAIRGTRLLVRGSVRTGRWVGRRVGTVKARGAGGETGMMRLFDLHAASCAGDTLITIGLAGTIFFNVPLGEARSKVALYLLVTMVPFALLAPVVGPLLDHFRHGRRYALAASMLGRAFLAWLISDYIHGFGLYPAAFGVLALSRAYGVARSAAVPRLLPPGLGLSQAGARASVYGTVAGAAAAPIGAAAFWFGPQWPLRVASVIFLIGMVTALRLPPRADADPPEIAPRPLRALGFRRGERALTGQLVWATLIGGTTLRALYGFLFLFLAFAVKAGHLSTELFGMDVGDEGALAVAAGALGVGTFLATAVGTRLRIHRPVALQSNGLVIVAGLAVLATIRFSLGMVALLCLVAAFISGISKLSVDATIQERIPERLRASAFAHSETILMLAFVFGGAFGLIPMSGRIGVGAAAAFGVLAALRAVVVARQLRKDRLNGRAAPERPPGEPGAPAPSSPPAPPPPPAVPTPAPRSPAAEPPPTADDPLAPPGFHIYRPSSSPDAADTDGEGSRPRRPGP
jgi:MFS family permease